MVQPVRNSHVFLVRTWSEARGEHLLALRGMVRNVHSGETRYFRTWSDLLAFIERAFEEQERSENPEHTQDDDGPEPGT